MNRADRRRLSKYGNVSGLDSTPTVNDYIHLYTLSFMLALDSCELGREKVREIMEKVTENAECMISGHINQQDIETMCTETYGIEFVAGIRNNIYVDGNKIIKA